MSLAIGIDIGGTHLRAGLVDSAGTVLSHGAVATRAPSLVPDMLALATRVLSEAGVDPRALVGVGVGTTGLVDRRRGTLARSMMLGLSDVPLRESLQARFRVDVEVDNDLHAATAGELMFGVGHRFRDFLLFNAGTGLSVGMVMGGRILRGASNTAGEFGHVVVDPRGPRCVCGRVGCLEAVVLEARDASEARGHAAPREPWSRAYEHLASGIVDLVNLLNPEAVVLTGGMFLNNREAADRVQRLVLAQAIPAAAAGLEHFGLVGAGDMAGLIGAAALLSEPDAERSARSDA